MVKIAGTWISNQVDKAIQMIPSTIAQEKYLVKRLRIQEASIKDIDDEVNAAARSDHSWARLARTSKMMNYWLPVGHNWRHHGADNDRCPCCDAPDETFQHLLQCPHKRIRQLCKNSLKYIEQAGSSLKIPTSIIWLALRIVQQECALADLPPPTDPTLHLIWEAQSKLGFSNFILGWFSRSWGQAIQYYGSDDPSGQTSQLLTLIWDGLCEPILTCRNDIRTNTPNPKDLLETQNLRQKLEWYKKYKEEVLPHCLRYLAEYSTDEIQRWDRDQRKTMVRMLEKSRKMYEIDNKQRVKGQRVMTEFFTTSFLE
jgi:hypothetical protein